MNLLCIIATTIIVAGIVAVGLEHMRSIENAGRNSHHLINEVSDIRIVFTEIKFGYEVAYIINAYHLTLMEVCANISTAQCMTYSSWMMSSKTS